VDTTAFKRSERIEHRAEPGEAEFLVEDLAERMQQFGFPVTQVQRLGDQSKEAAQGAAIFADGLAGGPSAPLINAMRLRECSGTVLDWISLPQAKQIRNMYKEA